MNWSLSFISLLLYMYLSCRENWIRCDESRHHSSLPVKLIFILKVNKYSLLCGDFWYSFYLSYILFHLCSKNTAYKHLFALVTLLCLRACLFYAQRNLCEMLIGCRQNKVNDAFCCAMIWQITCEGLRFLTTLLDFLLQQFLTWWITIESNIMIYL